VKVVPGRVQTVLGLVAASQLGRVNYHEHLFQVTPLLTGEELDDEARSGAEATLLGASGFESMVDATPIGLGRRASALARISQSTSLQVVATTGAHREAHYGTTHPLIAASVAELTDMFRRDVVAGLPISDTPGAEPARTPAHEPIRAGMLKAGIGYWSIAPFEHRVLEAVAAVHRETNAPVMVHLEHGSATTEVLNLLEADGVEPSAVVLAHIDRNPDPGLHAELAARGAYLGYDGAARHQYFPDSTLLNCLIETAQRGGAGRIVLGGDVARRSRYIAYQGMPGLGYLGNHFVPRLALAASAELVESVLQVNPQRLLARF